MSNKEWAKACGACAVSYQARMSLLVSEVCTDSGNDEHALMRQLQLKRWPTCRSFLLNLRNLHEGVKVTRSEIEQFKEAASAVPLLGCLHIIGRRSVPLTATSLEGVLMSCLAKHVSVLTLHVKSVMMSLNMPGLRHLVLRGSILSQAGSEQTYKALFLAIGGLKGLETLFVQYHDLTIKRAVDLTACVHLQHVAVQGVRFAGFLALPAACVVHTAGEPKFVGDRFRPMLREMVTDLSMCRTHSFTLYLYAEDWLPKHTPNTLESYTMYSKTATAHLEDAGVPSGPQNKSSAAICHPPNAKLGGA